MIPEEISPEKKEEDGKVGGGGRRQAVDVQAHVAYVCTRKLVGGSDLRWG